MLLLVFAAAPATEVFGAGEPVVLLHGGLANANYWGNQVPALARHYKVVVMDTRGLGRSSRNARAFGYVLMATDVRPARLSAHPQDGSRRLER